MPIDLLTLDEFATSPDSLRIYRGDRLIFNSRKDGLRPLMEYIDTVEDKSPGVTVYDRITGNGAALLCVLARVSCVYSPLGSDLASRTLRAYNVKYYFHKVVPFIEGRQGQGMCPMEAASKGQSPESFYEVMRLRYSGRDAAAEIKTTE
jgi:hypothetical protein